MKKYICDYCGKEVYESSLTTLVVNRFSVDLCTKCRLHLEHSRNDAISKADVEFMRSMTHLPIGLSGTNREELK